MLKKLENDKFFFSKNENIIKNLFNKNIKFIDFSKKLKKELNSYVIEEN